MGEDLNAIEYYQKKQGPGCAVKNDSMYSLALQGLGPANLQSMNFDTAIKYFEKVLKVQQDKINKSKAMKLLVH